MSFASEAPPWIVEVVHNCCWQLNPDMRANMGQVCRFMSTFKSLRNFQFRMINFGFNLQIARRIEQYAGITAPVLIATPVLPVVTKSGEALQPSGMS